MLKVQFSVSVSAGSCQMLCDVLLGLTTVWKFCICFGTEIPLKETKKAVLSVTGEGHLLTQGTQNQGALTSILLNRHRPLFGSLMSLDVHCQIFCPVTSEQLCALVAVITLPAGRHFMKGSGCCLCS